MSGLNIPSDFKPIIDFHGHLCPGLVIGYRAALIGRQIHTTRSVDEEMVAIVENDSCAVDAVQFMTGCTTGKGNLFLKDYGKHVYTFGLRPAEKNLRVSLRPGIFGDEDRDERIRKLLEMDDDELFDVREVDMELPPRAVIHNSVICSRCGEPVMETRTREKGGSIYCIPCYEELPR